MPRSLWRDCGRKLARAAWGSGVRTGPPRRRYFATVREETRIPGLNCNSLAMRSCPQVGLSAATSRIDAWRFLGKRGRPALFDFQRQKSRNPWRCQGSVSACTFTSALRHANHGSRAAIIQRVESSARRGLTFCSWNRANCYRRKRFSATNADRGRAARSTSRTSSLTA